MTGATMTSAWAKWRGSGFDETSHSEASNMDNPQQFESHADWGIDLGKLSLKEAIRAIKNLSIGSILAFGGLLFAILGGAFGFGRWTEVHAPHQVHRPPMPNSSLIQSGLTGVSKPQQRATKILSAEGSKINTGRCTVVYRPADRSGCSRQYTSRSKRRGRNLFFRYQLTISC